MPTPPDSVVVLVLVVCIVLLGALANRSRDG